MRIPDLDKERSEKALSLGDFLASYNERLPAEFPRASRASLKEFRTAHPGLFRVPEMWSLEQHRKKFMDWLPQHLQSLLRVTR